MMRPLRMDTGKEELERERCTEGMFMASGPFARDECPPGSAPDEGSAQVHGMSSGHSCKQHSSLSLLDWRLGQLLGCKSYCIPHVRQWLTAMRKVDFMWVPAEEASDISFAVAQQVNSKVGVYDTRGMRSWYDTWGGQKMRCLCWV